MILYEKTLSSKINNDLKNPNMADIYLGYSDEYLELMASPPNVNCGESNWMFWTSELYSFGKCFRFITGYPKSLPLCVYSDHSVPLSTRLGEHELDNNSNVYLTWSIGKFQRNKHLDRKKVFLCPHPWIIYRRIKRIEREKSTKGTIVFFPHIVPGYRYEFDVNSYIDKLNSLPDKFKPLVICLHMHDINMKYHKMLRQYGIPIVTAGHTSSVNFVDNFYELITKFSYATSPEWGSQVAYCIEIGLPYFFMGEQPICINESSNSEPLGNIRYNLDSSYLENEQKAFKLFGQIEEEVTIEQKEFINSLLGLHPDALTINQLKFILWEELLKSGWLIKKFLLSIYNELSKFQDRIVERLKKVTNGSAKLWNRAIRRLKKIAHFLIGRVQI